MARGPDGRSPLSRPPRPVAARVTTHHAGTVEVVRLDALDLTYCTVQPLPDARILVVGARARAGAPNAVVYDTSGQPVARGRLGDGIEHVQTTPTGRIWVGYFDEGVYGDDPIAHHGIARFTADLTPEWTYPYDTGHGIVDDCYALNVDGETAWAYYYSDFPIVRITEGTVTGWHTRTSGAHALCVAPDTVALVGGYGPDRDRLNLGYLGHDRHEPISDWTLALPDDQPVPPDRHMVARGPDLHVFVDTAWYRLSLDDLV